MIDNRDFAQLFSEVKSYANNVDYAIVNFESSIANKNIDKPLYKNGGNLCTSSFALDALKWAGFNVITLANNHTLDYRAKGLQQTISYAKKYGILTVGAGTNSQEASKPLYLKKGNECVAIINCCETEFSIAEANEWGANQLSPIAQARQIKEAKKNAQNVVVIVHGGHEHFPYPSVRMVDTYRFFIEEGADAVINHHQHCFCGYEVYQYCPIFYVLGNFCFDERKHINPELWHKGYMVELSFPSLGVNYKIIPYTQCEEDFLGVRLRDYNEFAKEISSLNSALSNPICLDKIIAEYYCNSQRGTLASIEPYCGRVLKSMYFKGLLPSRMKGNKA